MKELLALSEFRSDKRVLEQSVSKILNDFARKYHCEVDVEVDVVQTDHIGVGEAFVYHAHVTATF